jgi:thiol reductant ABC exporter CydC subunit
LEVPIVAVRFFGITRGLFRYGERYLSHLVTFKLLARLRLRFYQALEPLAPARLAAFHSGDLLARILGDIETLENFYVRVLHPPFVALLTALAVGVFLARYAALLALAWLTFLFLAGVALPWLARSLSRAPGKGLLQDRAVLSVVIVDGIQGLAELLAFGQAGRQLERIISTGERLADSQRRLAQINALQTALFGLLTNLGAWTVLVLAIPLVNAGQLQGVFLAVVVLAALTGFEAAQALPLAAQYLESNLQAARRLFEIIDAQPAVLDPPRPLPPPKRFDLVIEDLDFTYPGSPEAQPALHGFDLRLPFGRRVALVGASGAGKSTLVNLLLRFWEYDGGHIWLCGQELRDYHQDELRRLFAVVSQNTYLFSASLHENLLIARPQATQAEIEQAARRAHLHDFIQSLPEGYDTWVGEQGLRLSGGERQRLAIARALLKDAPMLILDEATANLDAVTERQVMVEIQALMEGRTTLAMTHRLAGLENMDEILVLHAGRVVERGVHADLLRRAGRYRRMWELQNQVIGEAPAVPVLAGSGSLLKEIG